MSNLSSRWLVVLSFVVSPLVNCASDNSNCQSFTGPSCPPASPSNLVATVSPTTIDLSWNDNSDSEDGFQIERAPGGTTTFTAIATTGTNITSYHDAGLAVGTTYRFRIRAYNTVGSSPYSNTVTATTFLAPVAVAYTDFDNANLSLYAWEGQQTVILSRDSALSEAVMAAILDATDKTYQYYQTVTAYTPSPAKVYDGKPTIADVPHTCGAGCGYLGATGIELQNTYFDFLYNQVQAHNQFDQVVFYEFGRNFWSLTPQLEYQAPDARGTITTGFAVFMRFMAMNAAGVQGGPFGVWSFAEFQDRVAGMIDLYLGDTTQTWESTLRVGQPQANNPSGLGSTDLFAAFVFRLRRDYGGDAFVAKLWKEAAKRPPAASTQDAVDNFFLASCTAANRNLTALFTTAWRWPISAAAKLEAEAYPS